MINLKIDNYKDTSQMASWRKLKLGDHIDILTGYSFKSKLFNTEGDGKPLIRNRNINNQIPDIYTTESYDQSYVVLPGDILITMDGDFNIAKWTGVESLLNQRVLKINKYDNETIVKNYLLYSLEKHLDYIHRITSGTTVKHLKKSDIENLIIPIPPIKEQQKIAEILSTVDEQIEQTDQLIEKTKELKKGLMQQLLTKGIGHTEFKQTELGEIPGEWEVTSLKNLGSFFKGKGIAKKDMSTNGNKCILYGQLYTTYKEIINEVDTYTDINIKNPVIGEKNDLLIPSSGETPFDIATASSLQVNEVYIGGDINVFRPANQMNSDFLSYQINSVRKFELSKLAQGSSIYHLYKDNLEKFDVLVPPLKEQKQIVEILSAVDEEIEGYEEEKVKYEELKKGLMQQLLTGKKRVKVN